MKKTHVIILSVLLVTTAVVVASVVYFRSQSPAGLLRRLASGSGDKEDLIMQLNVARGDIVTPMIEGFRDLDAPAEFRADMVELLFKQDYRFPDPRIHQIGAEALKDKDAIVRRKAAYCLAMYGDPRRQAALAECVDDPDPEIRRQVYQVLAANVDPLWQDPSDGVWQELADETKTQLIAKCKRLSETEKDKQLAMLARSVIGRHIEVRVVEATRALVGSNVEEAEKILKGCLELDPDNAQAQIRLARFYLDTGRKQKALETAREYGAVIEVPELSAAPVIDGDPTDDVWSEAYTTESFYQATSRWIQIPTAGRSLARIGHLDGRIYIAVIGYESDITKLAAHHTKRDDEIWRDDCVELIFDPSAAGRGSYYFAVNPIGAVLDQALGNRAENFKCQYQVKVFLERSYWALELAIEAKEFGGATIGPDEVWSLNIFRTRIGAASEQCAIWPTFGNSQRISLHPLVVFK